MVAAVISGPMPSPGRVRIFMLAFSGDGLNAARLSY
jgi:hypothetical protein